jgi:hypothetical protein
MSKSLLFTGAIVAAVVLSGVKVYADSAADIEQYYATSNTVTYDNNDNPAVYPIITAIASQPGTFGGRYFTGWSLLVADGSGSLDLFTTASILNTISTNSYTTPAVGDAITVNGFWSPYHSIPEMAFATSSAHQIGYSANYIFKVSSGNATPSKAPFTISQINTTALISNQVGVAGWYIEVDNVTFSGSTGSFQSVFPNNAQANLVDESYTITDSTGSMEMFDYVTSYSTSAALGGTAVPTGACNVYGFLSVYPSSGQPDGKGLAEFTAITIVPEPSTVMLVGLGLVGLLGIRRRRS